MRNVRLKLAILDMYADTPNQGMRAIKEIVRGYEHVLDWKVFDVRSQCDLPDTSFDIYISSGGPGHPLDGDGIWDQQFFHLLDELWLHNRSAKGPKKYVFFICHSFQMACHHFGLASITQRKSRSFGTFPAHKTEDGQQDSLLQILPDPFYIADFRDYQVVQPDWKALEGMNAQILALEKIRPHVPLERAIMAVRFSEEFFGTQFHPEADPHGMMKYFGQEEKKQEIIKEHGVEKFEQMMEDLNDPLKIPLTHQMIIPGFLNQAVEALQKQYSDQPAAATNISQEKPPSNNTPHRYDKSDQGAVQ
ncbi:MAG: GMP synthase [Bacteroidota bacterium]